MDSDLDVVQKVLKDYFKILQKCNQLIFLFFISKYLKQTKPDAEYNDEIVASYLSCNGLLSQNNQCLQRLVCQFVDRSENMPDLEKEVSSL